jgi:hypothetical protein
MNKHSDSLEAIRASAQFLASAIVAAHESAEHASVADDHALDVVNDVRATLRAALDKVPHAAILFSGLAPAVH